MDINNGAIAELMKNFTFHPWMWAGHSGSGDDRNVARAAKNKEVFVCSFEYYGWSLKISY